MVAKDVSKGGQGEVVVGGKVGIVGSENGERGAVQKIRGEGRGGGKEGGDLGELRHDGEEEGDLGEL